MIFGVSEFSLRFPSLLFGLMGIIAFFYFTKKYYTKLAYISTGILSISVFHIAYSQIGRTYSLFFLFTVLCLHFFHDVIFENKNHHYFVLFNVLLVYTHIFAFYFILFEMLFSFYIKKKKIIHSFIYIFIASLPGILFIMFQIYRKLIGVSHTDWMSATKISEIYWVFSAFSSSYILTPLFILLLFVWLFRKNFFFKGNNEKKDILLVLNLLVCVFLPLLFSYIVTPMFALRYFLIAYPAFLLVVTDSILSIKYKFLKYGVLTFIIVFLIISSVVYFSDRKDMHYDSFNCFNEIKSDLALNVYPLYTPRWLNEWLPKHKPIDKAHIYLEQRLGMNTTLVNNFNETRLLEPAIFLSPAISHMFIDTQEFNETSTKFCRGLSYKVYE